MRSKACAEQCDTKMFWVVDADAEVTESFNFDYIPDVYDEEVVPMASKNPINGLEYGYGGAPNCFPQKWLKTQTLGIDFTTGPAEDLSSMRRGFSKLYYKI